MRICICDDTKEDIKKIESAIKSYYETNKNIKYAIESFSTADDFLNKYNEDPNYYDILILDIYLDDKNGFSIAKSIKEKNNIPIILFSSSRDFAIDGYQINIFGYLVKPLDEEILFSLLNKYHKLSNDKIIQLKTNGKTELLNINKIVFIESKARKVIIHLIDNITKTYYYSLDEIEKIIDCPIFLRTHKSFLVNMKKIIKAQDSHFVVENDKIVQIKQKALKTIHQQYNDYILKENNFDSNS